MKNLRDYLIVGSVVFASACGGAQPAPEEPMAGGEPAEEGAAPAAEEGADEPAAAPATFAEQVTLGGSLYGQKCASCHGAAGEGGDAPAVVGLSSGALPLDPPSGAKYRKTQFKTVADIATFVVQTMPPGAAGSLTEEEYWSILAFDLKANGIDLGDKKLTGELAATLDVPR
jgi:S-disulfanyl-L-cysteine oxidoreductase SoxD